MACDVFSSYIGSGIVLTRDFYLVYFIIISMLLDLFCMKKVYSDLNTAQQACA